MDKYQEARTIYDHAGLMRPVGFGHRPALLVIDLQKGFTDTEQSELAGNLSTQIEAVNILIRLARKRALPIVFTVISYDDSQLRDAGLWVKKAPTLEKLKSGSGLDDLDERIESESGDLIIVKKYASAFFGTPLASFLLSLGVDTIIATGCTTSGCVRASVVDSLQNGFKTIVPLEAVGDRAQGPHEASLFDMNSKYADVLNLNTVVDYLEHL